MPPHAFKKVYHRLNKEAAYKFDGLDYWFTPHETKILDMDIALHFQDSSVFKWDPAMERVERALVMEGDPDFEKPYEGEVGQELIDRTNDPEPFVKRGIEDGAPRKTVYKVVQGSEADMKKKGAGVF